MDEVGVGVEDDDAQVGVDEEPFEQHPEGVGLARPTLPAEERVPVESCGADERGSGGAGDRFRETLGRDRLAGRR